MSIRPANLVRPVRSLAIDPNYSDPHLEELVRVAAERARESARAEGYAAGWSQGRQAASVRASAEQDRNARLLEAERLQVGERVAKLLTSLAEVTRAARVAVAPEWTEVADALSAGALRLAAAALGRELTSVDDSVEQAVTAALRQLADPGEAVVHLNPAEAGLVDENVVGVTVIADALVEPGNVMVLTPSQRLLHDLPAALAAAEEVLKS